MIWGLNSGVALTRRVCCIDCMAYACAAGRGGGGRRAREAPASRPPMIGFVERLLLLVLSFSCSAHTLSSAATGRSGLPLGPPVEDRASGTWGQQWAARRRGKLNSLLEALVDVAQEHSDVVEYYTYHPEAASNDGLGQVAGSLLPGLSLLAQEGLGDHRLELSRREEELVKKEKKSTAQNHGTVPVETEHDAGVLPQCDSSSSLTVSSSHARCAGPIPSGQIGRDPSLPFYRFVIVLASAPSHFEYRQVMRNTWLSPSSLGTRANDTLVLFAVGQVRDSELEGRLGSEHAQRGDLLRTPSYDGYRNLSVKVFEGYVWTAALFFP
jgi:hypothetical protein